MKRQIKENKLKNSVFKSHSVQPESSISSKAILSIFKEYKMKHFIFVEPGGNFGDYLICKGAQKLANIAGIRFQSVSHHEFMNSTYSSDTVIYIHGSGGYVPWWSGNPIMEFRKAVKIQSGIVILGPTTFTVDQSFLKKTICLDIQNNKSSKIFIFSRDNVSFQALKKCLPGNVELDLDHDTALNLTLFDLIQNNLTRSYPSYFIRDDKEAVCIQNRDYLALWLDPIKYCHNFSHWLFIHGRAKKIITNRLHSAVVGSILGVPTILLPNNYHKNRSVWEYSLCQRGVEWSDNIPIRRTARILNSIYPIKKILSLSKFQAALRTLYSVHYSNLPSEKLNNYF